jgi:hypothetical protein
MEKLIDAIKKYVELTDNDIELINNLFITKKLRKNECFITPGKPCDNFAFIEKGLFKHSLVSFERTLCYFVVQLLILNHKGPKGLHKGKYGLL